MSKNIKIIEELYSAFKSKDYESFSQICDKNIRWNQNPGFPRGGSYIGYEEVVENVFKLFDITWDEWRFDIEDYFEAGDTIIVTGTYQGTHKETGKSFSSQAAHFYRVKDEKVVSFQQYADTKVICDAMDNLD